MGHHIVGDSPFMKRVLIPFWIVRIIVMLIFIAAYALVLGFAIGNDDVNRALREYGVSVNDYNTIIAISAVIMSIVVICLIMDIVCIIKRARRTLTPRYFLISNVIQTTIFTINFVLSMIGARTGLTVGVGVLIYLSFFGLLIYASVIFHQYRKGTLKSSYQPANPGQGGYEAHSLQNVPYPSYAGAAYGQPQQHPQPYPQQQQQKPAYYDGHSQA